MPPPDRLVVLVSGSGTNLQALLDAAGDPAYGARVVAVGADRTDIEALRRADRFGVDTFVHRVRDFPSRADWDIALAATVASYAPHLVVLAGFMKLVGPAFLAEHGGRTLNTHPALSPAFPGMHGPAEAVAYGSKVSGCTLFVVDEGVDTGPIVDQTCGPRRGRRHGRDAPRTHQDRGAADARRSRREDGAGGVPRGRAAGPDRSECSGGRASPDE